MSEGGPTGVGNGYVAQPRSRRPLAALCNFLVPLLSIKRHPYSFFLWTVVAFVGGLTVVWFPIVYVAYAHGSVHETWHELIESGVLLAFSLILITEGMATSIASPSGQESRTARVLRSIVVLIAFFLYVAVLAVLAGVYAPGRSSSLLLWPQLALLLASLALSVYLFGFRFADWSEGVEKISQEEESQVRKVIDASKSVTNDQDGVEV